MASKHSQRPTPHADSAVVPVKLTMPTNRPPHLQSLPPDVLSSRCPFALAPLKCSGYSTDVHEQKGDSVSNMLFRFSYQHTEFIAIDK